MSDECTCHPDERPTPCMKKYAWSECMAASLAARDAEIARLREALGAMIYETTSLSPMEDDGSHWCRITKEALELVRAAYHGADAHRRAEAQRRENRFPPVELNPRDPVIGVFMKRKM